jgi:hypothetical protein
MTLFSKIAFAGALPDSKALIAEAAVLVDKIADDDEKNDTLELLLTARARTGDIAGAKLLADQVVDARTKKFAYEGIANSLAHSGDAEGARALLSKAGVELSGLYEQLAGLQAKKGDVKSAIASADKITDSFYKAHALANIARAQAKAGDYAAAKASLAAINDAPDVYVQGLAQLAEDELAAGRDANATDAMNLALTGAKGVPAYMAGPVRCTYAKCMVRFGKTPLALQAADKTTDAEIKAMMLDAIASKQLEMGDLAGAANTGEKIAAPFEKAQFTLELAEAKGQKSDAAGARELMHSAVALSTKLKGHERALLCNSIGAAMARMDPDHVMAWARSQTEPESGARAILGIVEASPDYKDPFE